MKKVLNKKSPRHDRHLITPTCSVLQLLALRVVRRLPRVSEADFPRRRRSIDRDFETNSLHVFGRRIEVDFALHAFRHGGTVATAAEENAICRCSCCSSSSSAAFHLRRRVSGDGSPRRRLLRREDRGGRRVDDVGGEDDPISAI